MCIQSLPPSPAPPCEEALIISILIGRDTEAKTEVRRIAVRDLGSTWQSPDSNLETRPAPQQGRKEIRRTEPRTGAHHGRAGMERGDRPWIKPMCRTVLGERSPAKEQLWSKREA